MSYAHSRILTGYLKKKGLGGWKTRFCVLSEDVLYYFKKEEDASTAAVAKGEKPDGSLSCAGCGVYQETEPLFAFSVVLAQTKKKSVFQAPTAKEAEAWTRELKRVSGRIVYTLDDPAEFPHIEAGEEPAVMIHGEDRPVEQPSVALHYDFDGDQTDAPRAVAKSLEKAPSDLELDSDSEAEDDGEAPANTPAFPSASSSSSASSSASSSTMSSSSSTMSSSSSTTSLIKSPSRVSLDSEDEPPPPPPFEGDLSPRSRKASLLASAPTRDAPRAAKSPTATVPANPKLPFLAAPERSAPRLPDKKPTLAQLEHRGLPATSLPLERRSSDRGPAPLVPPQTERRSSVPVVLHEEEPPNFVGAAKMIGMIKTPRVSVHSKPASGSDSENPQVARLPSTTTMHTRSGSIGVPSPPVAEPETKNPLMAKGGNFIAPRRNRLPSTSSPLPSDDPPPPPADSDDETPPPPSDSLDSVSSSPLPSNLSAEHTRPTSSSKQGLSPPPLPAFSGNASLPITPPANVVFSSPPTTHRSSIVAEASEKGLFKQFLSKPPPRRRSFKYPESSFNSPPQAAERTLPRHTLPPRPETAPPPAGPQLLPHRMSRSSMVIHFDDRRLTRGSISRGGGVYAGYCKILKGRLRKKWENRYFTLDPQSRSLLYRESWDSQITQKHRTISLIGAHVSAVERFREHGYCWMIQTPRRSYFICAFTPEDQMEWVRAITRLLNPTDDEPLPPPPVEEPLDCFPPPETEIPESDPIEASWLAWEATQRELEYQRELTLFLLEINQDDFTGREKRQVRFVKGENLMAPKMLYQTPGSVNQGKSIGLNGDVQFSPEMAQAFAKYLDSGRMVWLQASGGTLRFTIEGEALVEGDLLSAYELKCPPSKNNPNFDEVGKQFQTLEATRHTAAVALLEPAVNQVDFAALLCRHLRRPEDGVRRAAMGSSLCWMSKGQPSDAIVSLQALFGFLVSNQVILSDVCCVWDVVAKGLPALSSLYNQSFGISVVAGMKHGDDRRCVPHQRSGNAERKDATPPRETRESVTTLIDPSKIFFIENGNAIKENLVATKISQALQNGLFVVFALTKHREVEFLIESNEEALDVREAWNRWKQPFTAVPPHCLAEIFPKILPAWTAIERNRYDMATANLPALFPQAPVLMLCRFMQQSPDMVKPPVFGDVLLKWLPPMQSLQPKAKPTAMEEAPLTWHSNRLMDWLVDNHVVCHYTVQIPSHKKVELLSYDRMYHQLFLAAPNMFTALSSTPANPAPKPAPTSTLSSHSIFAPLVRVPIPCFSSYFLSSSSPLPPAPRRTSISANASSPASPASQTPESATATSPSSGRLTPRDVSEVTTTPKIEPKKIKKQPVVLSDESSDSGDEGYQNPAERAWAEGRLTHAFTSFPATNVPLDKEQIMGMCIELATEGLQEEETARFVSLLTGGECPSLGAMLYDFVDKTGGGHDGSESEEEGDAEETPAASSGTLAEF